MRSLPVVLLFMGQKRTTQNKHFDLKWSHQSFSFNSTVETLKIHLNYTKLLPLITNSDFEQAIYTVVCVCVCVYAQPNNGFTA